MTDKNIHTPETEKSENSNSPTGYTDVTGPAAFKAHNKDQDPPASAQPSEADKGVIIELVEKLTKSEEDLAEKNDQLLRAIAEVDNLRKRSVREREDASKYAISGFAKDLLDVADTFRRALQAIPEELRKDEKVASLVQGIEATERSLLSCFEKNGIKKIEPLDESFNPNFHEVMFESLVPGKSAGTIIQVIEPGT
jgi:molecular chaperone GrpE